MANHAKPSKLRWLLKGIDTDKAKDTGMALCLIALLMAYLGGKHQFLVAAIIIIVLNMTVPSVFKPIARLWFGLAHVVGAFMSRIILTVVFFLVVTPVGILRKWMQRDTLLLKRWKKDGDSVFQKRFYRYDPNDLDRPY